MVFGFNVCVHGLCVWFRWVHVWVCVGGGGEGVGGEEWGEGGGECVDPMIMFI